MPAAGARGPCGGWGLGSGMDGYMAAPVAALALGAACPFDRHRRYGRGDNGIGHLPNDWSIEWFRPPCKIRRCTCTAPRYVARQGRGGLAA